MQVDVMAEPNEKPTEHRSSKCGRVGTVALSLNDSATAQQNSQQNPHISHRDRTAAKRFTDSAAQACKSAPNSAVRAQTSEIIAEDNAAEDNTEFD